MKQTGIVRRIDNLGRIVIPKEIRKTFHIRDGETLEMFAIDDNIVLRKYSTIKELNDIFAKLIDLLDEYVDGNILITDLDSVLFCSKNIHNLYCGKNVSNFLTDIINNRKEKLSTDAVDIQLIDNMEDKLCYYIIPLVSSYDPIGSLILFSKNGLSKDDIRFCNILGKFVNSYIEE